MSELTYRVLLHEESWQCSLLTFRSRSTAHLPIPPRIHSSHVAAHTAVQRKSQISTAKYSDLLKRSRSVKLVFIQTCPGAHRSKHCLLKLKLMRSCGDELSSEDPPVLESEDKHELLITLH